MRTQYNWPGFPAIVRLLVDGIDGRGVDSNDLRALFGIDKKTARYCLRYLYHAKMAHVTEWTASGNATIPRFRFGAGQDAPCHKRAYGLSYIRPTMDFITFKSIYEELQATAHYGSSLSEAIGNNDDVCRAMLQKMHGLRLAYIAEYTKTPTGGDLFPKYLWGIDEADIKKSKVCARQQSRGRRTRLRQLEMLRMLAGQPANDATTSAAA